MEIRINQTGHSQKELSFQRSGIIYYHDILHHPNKLPKQKSNPKSNFISTLCQGYIMDYLIRQEAGVRGSENFAFVYGH
jgi:hypothetical protein